MAVRNVYWPQIESAASWLVQQQLLTPAQLQRLQAKATTQAIDATADFAHSLDDRLSKELTESYAAGEGSVAWQERVSKVVDVTAAEAETIGRTYTHRAYHAGIDEVMSNPIVADEFGYLLYEATGDSRTRATHLAMSGKVAYKDSPLADEMRRLVNEWNCILPENIVAGEVQIAIRSKYRGKAVEIKTLGGRILRVTKNHPVLTSHGLVAAGSLQQGDELFLDVGNAKLTFAGSSSQNQNKPLMIEDVFGSLSRSKPIELFGAKGSDLHGDAATFDRNIEVVRADRVLLLGDKPVTTDHVSRVVLEKPLSKRVGRAKLACAPIITHARPLQKFCLASSSDLDAAIFQPPKQNRSRNIVRVGQRFKRATGQIRFNDRIKFRNLNSSTAYFDSSITEPSSYRLSLDAHMASDLAGVPPETIKSDRIVSLRAFEYFGHVYDLQTKTGFINANGIIIGNCRCTLIPISRDEALAKGIDDDTGYQPPAAARVERTADVGELVFS